MTVTISRLYGRYAAATQAVRDLEAAASTRATQNHLRTMPTIGIEHRARKTDRVDRDQTETTTRCRGAEAGARLGAVVRGNRGRLRA